MVSVSPTRTSPIKISRRKVERAARNTQIGGPSRPKGSHRRKTPRRGPPRALSPGPLLMRNHQQVVREVRRRTPPQGQRTPRRPFRRTCRHLRGANCILIGSRRSRDRWPSQTFTPSLRRRRLYNPD